MRNVSSPAALAAPYGQGATGLPLLGTKGLHGAYHLSPDEKNQLQQEIRDFAASRFAGRACPSCLWDALFGAVYEHARITLQPENPRMNSGLAADFMERAPDWARHLMGISHRARDLVQEHADEEQRTGRFRSGGLVGDLQAGWENAEDGK